MEPGNVFQPNLFGNVGFLSDQDEMMVDSGFSWGKKVSSSTDFSPLSSTFSDHVFKGGGFSEPSFQVPKPFGELLNKSKKDSMDLLLSEWKGGDFSDVNEIGSLGVLSVPVSCNRICGVGDGDDNGGDEPPITLDILSEHWINMNHLALDGKFDDLVDRDSEVRRLMHHLIGGHSRRHAILCGPTHAGKMSVVRRLAYHMTHQPVPEELKKKTLITLDLDKEFDGMEWRERIPLFFKECLQLKDEVICVVPNVDQLLEHRVGRKYLIEYLSDAMNSGLQVVATGSQNFAKEWLESDGVEVSKIKVTSMPLSITVERLAKQYMGKEELLGVSFTKEAINQAVALIHRELQAEGKVKADLYKKTLPLLDSCVAEAKIRAQEKPGSEGVPLVDTALVNEVYRLHRPKGPKGGSGGGGRTGIDGQAALDLSRRLKTHVYGQDHAIDSVSRYIVRSCAGLDDSENKRPVGSFLFLGPTGVGKSELAKRLAQELDGYQFKTLDMTEYMEKHTSSRLFGAPPGYVGYDKGGELTGWLKKHPRSVILLDEMDKAHPDIVLNFMQVLDEARMTDGQGRTIDCSEAIFIMTSNFLAKQVMAGFEAGLKPEEVKKAVEPHLSDILRPEVYNRLDEVIPFKQLSKETFKSLIEMKVKRRFQPITDSKGIDFEWTDGVIEYLYENGYQPAYGLRPLKRLMEKKMIAPLAEAILSGKVVSGDKVIFDVAQSEGETIIVLRTDTDPAPNCPQKSSMRMFETIGKASSPWEDQPLMEIDMEEEFPLEGKIFSGTQSWDTTQKPGWWTI